MIKLPYTYALKDTLEIALELDSLHINSQHRMATFDIKDLYVKLPIQDIIKAKRSNFNNNKLINEKLICAFRWSVFPSIIKMHGPKNKIIN
jgi:hypothetical protein